MKEKHGCLAHKRTVNYLTILGRPIMLPERVNRFLWCDQNDAIQPIHVAGTKIWST